MSRVRGDYAKSNRCGVHLAINRVELLEIAVLRRYWLASSQPIQVKHVPGAPSRLLSVCATWYSVVSVHDCEPVCLVGSQ